MQELSVDKMFEQAMRHHQAGQVKQAESLYHQIIGLDPNEADALHLLGVLEFQTHRADKAVARIRQAVEIDPAVAEYHFNLGLALAEMGQTQDALAAYDRAISLKNDFPDACNARGVLLAQSERFEEAIASFRLALTHRPDYAEALSNLGNALTKTRQFDQAIGCLRQATALAPNFAAAHNNLGIALEAGGHLEQSIQSLRKAVELRPNYSEAMNNLAKSLQLKEESQEAAALCREAIRLRPNYAIAHSTLGNALKDLGLVEEAIAAYRTALKLRPELINCHSSLLLAMHYDAQQHAQGIFQEHLRWNEQFGMPLTKEIGPHQNDRNPNRPLRVGYVSPDFCAHSISYFFENLLANHDPKQVEVFCYADLIHSDAVTARLKKLAANWRETTKIDNASLAEMIREDRIDILVDLAGHTGHNRLRLFARKPAPVQVSYLGYPDTTGLQTMDYRLTDALADPAGMTDEFYTEKLARLPRSFLCYRPAENAPQVSALPAQTKGYVTFGSLNILPKITTPMLRLWSQILRQVAGSRLILKSYLGLNSAETRQRILDIFVAEGIEPNRIELRGKVADRSAYLSIYNEIDMALDTFPYHGTTMTCESLWMGVPVIALAGKTHVSRVGVSLLTNAGLPQLIGQSPEQYVRLACDWSADLTKLAELRRSLRGQMASSAVTDGPGIARDVEAAYRQMWTDHLR